MKTNWFSIVVTAAFAALLAGCGGSDSSSSPAAAVYNLNFMGGAVIQADRPAAVPGPAAPIITDTDYYPVTRQGGSLHFVITLEDDDYDGVTALILQIEGTGQYFTFDVTALDDPLSPGTITINITIILDPNFMPGTFTMFIGLEDEDGNVGDYVARLLVVKSLAGFGIASLEPADGSVDVGVNTVIRAVFLQQILDGEAEIEVLGNGAPVTGSTYLSADGRTLTFVPDPFLEPGVTFEAAATLLVNGVSLSSSFTTADPPPLADPAGLAGLVFAFNLAKENLAEPQEGKAIFDLISFFPAILTKIVSVDAPSGALSLMGGLGEDEGGGVYKQLNLAPAFGPNPGSLDNPWFSFGPSRLNFPLTALGLPGEISLEDFMLSGHFVADGTGTITGFEQGVLTARINSANINDLMAQMMGKSFDMCQLIPICDAEGYIRVRAEGLSGFSVSGVNYLYGIRCTADPDSINAAAGADIDVTCTTTRDGDGFLDADISFSARTGPFGSDYEVGTWDYPGGSCSGTPPVCSAPDASGQVTVRLTVDPGELTAGDQNFRAGGSYSSPVGKMTTAHSIAVE